LHEPQSQGLQAQPLAPQQPFCSAWLFADFFLSLTFLFVFITSFGFVFVFGVALRFPAGPTTPFRNR
jgi:hypothetical protein